MSGLRKHYDGPIAKAFQAANDEVDRRGEAAGPFPPLAPTPGKFNGYPIFGAPTVNELRMLSDLCSDAEWKKLLAAHGFIDAASTSLVATERFMSARLGRKISLSAPSIKNPGDKTL